MDLGAILFPGTCVVCGDHLPLLAEHPFPLCRPCAQVAPIDAPSRCAKCSKPLISEIDVCTRCRARDFVFERNFSLFSYRGRAGELIRAYKFRRVISLSGFFAEHVASFYRSNGLGGPIVPAPGRRSAVRKRGYDPVGLIARRLRRICNIPVLDILRRNGGRPQKTLNYEGRLTNLAGTIRAPRHARVPSAVVLLDDVFTTGATANECARVLLAAGAAEVQVITLSLD